MTALSPSTDATRETMVLANGDIVTMDPRAPLASCVVVVNGVIAAVGDHSIIQRHAPNARIVDLNGATVVPGFIDTHVHGGVTGLGMLACDLTGTATVSDVLDRVAGAANGQPADGLLVASGFDPGAVAERRFPTALELDAAAGNRAVYLMGQTGHESAVNAAAAKRIVTDSKPIEAGTLTGEDNTKAFVQLWEQFGRQVGVREALVTVMGAAAEGGITTVHSMDPLYVTELLATHAGEWPINVVPYAETFDVKAVMDLGLRQVGGCGTVALDGDVDPHTAALLAPYSDDPSTSGVLYHHDDVVRSFVTAAEASQIQVALHCVGSGAIEQLLDAYEAVFAGFPDRDRRHRVEHFEIPEPGQAERAARLAVAVAVQPAFNYFWPSDTGYPVAVGVARAERVDPIRTLIEAGVRTSFGSDSPVTPLRPLLGMHAAVNHSNPTERVDAATALRAFTSDAAWFSFDEDRRGSIKQGYDADLTVLGANPLSAAASEIADIAIHATIVRGRVEFSDGRFFS